MYCNPVAQSCRSIPAVLFAVLFLNGCLLQEESETSQEDPGDDSGETLKNHELVGSVGDGPIVGAEVRVRSSDGASLGTADSDASADFALVVKTASSDYPLEIDASGGTDLVTMTVPDFSMRSAVLQPGAKSVANVNPFTTFAMELATDLDGGVTEENILTALEIVVAEVGSGLDTMSGTDALRTAIDAGNVAEMVKASEALGEVVRRTRDALRAVGRNVSGTGVVTALGSDLTDGVIDGRGGPRADARTAAIANVVLAAVMLEAMPNRLEVQGTVATGRIDSAIGQVFDGTPDPALDELPVTPAMLDAARIGLLAGAALQPSATLEALLAELDALSAGMTPGEAAAVLTTDPGAALDNLALVIAQASAAGLEVVNEVVRTGGGSSSNRVPEIGGTPATSVVAGSSYEFTPTASDADGDALTFDVSNLPGWASFDDGTGRIDGTPGSGQVGSYGNIVISVSDGQASASLGAFSITVEAPPAGNTPPAISGNPPSAVMANSDYEFVPQASDEDGDPLTFSVAGLPSWANFDSGDGRLHGTPGDGDVGVYGGVVITVSDGEDSASLGPFEIAVEAVTLGSATLSWTPPTLNTDGTALTDLAGYRIYWGTMPGNYTESVELDNPGLTSYVIENLAPAEYEFAVTAINESGVESDFSNAATKTIP